MGHAKELAEGCGLTVELWAGNRVPIVPKALELARDGIIPAGAYRNLDFAAGRQAGETRGNSPGRCWTASTIPRPPADCWSAYPERPGGRRCWAG